MALFPFLKRRDAAEAPSTPADQVRRARTRARQRLVGAVVLLGIGIVGFPLLFETQPRPIPVDVTIEIPRKDAVPPLAPPPKGGGARVSGQVGAPAADGAATAEPATTAPAEPAAPASAAVATATDAPPVPPTVSPRPAKVEPRPTPAATPGTAAVTTPAAPPATAVVAAPKPEAAAARYVVQVGAFADPGAAQKTRERVERLGLKTYTQVIETGDGLRTRVRVGPFASRDEADKAAARVQSAGLAAAVLTL